MKHNVFSIAELQKVYDEYVKKEGWISLTLTKEELMNDQEVADLFGISIRALQTCRQKGEIKYFKLGNRYYYIRSIILLDILRRYND